MRDIRPSSFLPEGKKEKGRAALPRHSKGPFFFFKSKTFKKEKLLKKKKEVIKNKLGKYSGG
jgi:hypothetical protein